MKFYLAAALAAVCCAQSGVALAADVGVSVQISQPGVYGRIDIGRYPQPQVVWQQPVLVVPAPRWVQLQAPPPPPQPVYLWVPPGHRKNWRKHCQGYGACGVPVYFVQDRWYGQHVQRDERYDERGKGRGHGHGRGDERGRDQGGDKHRH
jgi:hypothetical protein